MIKFTYVEFLYSIFWVVEWTHQTCCRLLIWILHDIELGVPSFFELVSIARTTGFMNRCLLQCASFTRSLVCSISFWLVISLWIALGWLCRKIFWLIEILKFCRKMFQFKLKNWNSVENWSKSIESHLSLAKNERSLALTPVSLGDQNFVMIFLALIKTTIHQKFSFWALHFTRTLGKKTVPVCSFSRKLFVTFMWIFAVFFFFV
jgi:hypothetical protein